MGNKSEVKLSSQDIGKVIKEMRLTSGKSQCEVGRILGKGQDVVNKFENGSHYPRLDKFLEWAMLFGCEVRVSKGDYTIMKVGGEEEEKKIAETRKKFAKHFAE